MRSKSLKSGLLTVIIFGLVIGAIRIVGDGLPDRLDGPARATDGDSLVMDGYRIRLIGIDAPEFAQVCTADGRDVACGRMAKDALADRVSGREINCMIADEDRYQRLLGRCFVGAADIGAAQVAAGSAVATDDYHDEEARARAAQSGLWAMEFADPAAWREQNGTPGGRGIWSLF